MITYLKSLLSTSWLITVTNFAREMLQHNITDRAASVALFSMISIFPILAILTWLLTTGGVDPASSTWASSFRGFLPPDVRVIVDQEIQYRLDHNIQGSAWTVTFNILLLLISSGAASRSILFAFRRIAHAEEEIGIVSIFWRSLVFVLVTIGVMFLGSLVLGALVLATRILDGRLHLTGTIGLIQWLTFAALLTGVFNALYIFSLRGYKHRAIHGWWGAILAAALVSTISLIFTLIYEIYPFNELRYGAPGHIINVLLWFYFCSVSALLGAQLNSWHASRSGERRKSTRNNKAAKLTDS